MSDSAIGDSFALFGSLASDSDLALGEAVATDPAKTSLRLWSRGPATLGLESLRGIYDVFLREDQVSSVHPRTTPQDVKALFAREHHGLPSHALVSSLFSALNERSSIWSAFSSSLVAAFPMAVAGIDHARIERQYSALSRVFVIESPDAVRSFLPDGELVSALVEGSEILRSTSEILDTPILRVLSDVGDGDDRELQVLAPTKMGVQEARNYLERFDEKWWLALRPKVRRLVTADVLFQ